MTVQITHNKVATLPDQPGVEINKGEWNDPHNIIGLATVASSGAYSDLTGLPTLGTLAALNSASLTANVTGILPLANGGTNTNAVPGAGQIVWSDGTKYTSDANLTWSATTGLLSQKGISSKGAANGAGTELYGLGAFDNCTLATTNNTISGAGAGQSGNNGFEIGNVIYGQGSTISSATLCTLLGQGASISAPFTSATTSVGQGVTISGGTIVTNCGALNIISGISNQASICGSQNNFSPPSVGAIGAFGNANNYAHKRGGIFGGGVTSYRDNELAIGWAFADPAQTFGLSFTGTTGAFTARQLARQDTAWIDSTDATRKARSLFYVTDTADREYMRADANGSGADVFFNAASYSFNVPVKTKGYTVATLPAGSQGMIAYVTDALAPTFLAIIVGGGAVVSPVFYNGTNWVGF